MRGVSSGLASTTTRSASKPGRSWPTRASSRSSSALTVVADCSAAIGVSPASTSSTTSREMRAMLVGE
ncbi:MAG: hypothetical protein R2708_06405 [Vicinamibacterales bacterium]